MAGTSPAMTSEKAEATNYSAFNSSGRGINTVL